MRSEGHSLAHRYPIWMVWEEADIVRKRINSRIVTDATAMYRAVGAAIAGITGGKEAVDDFNEFLQGFSDGDED